jgi:CheY-like chemotaxis protein
MRADEQKTILKVLIVDDQPFQRRLIAETLRTMGRVRIEQAESMTQCFEALSFFAPDLLITDWDMAGGDGLDLVRRLRIGEAGEHLKALPVIMAAERNKCRDVEKARNSGVDEFLLKPFNTAALVKRVEEVQRARRDFIESVVYVGPCRRRARRVEAEYEGPKRRLFDADDVNADAPDVQIKKGLARMYAERIQVLTTKAAPDNPNGMRDVSLACAQLSQLATDMGDKMLMSASSSLFSYAKGLGADGVLNPGVVKAHLDAIVQLAELPNSQYELRATVTRELSVMVTKKLRAAAAA